MYETCVVGYTIYPCMREKPREIFSTNKTISLWLRQPSTTTYYNCTLWLKIRRSLKLTAGKIVLGKCFSYDYNTTTYIVLKASRAHTNRISSAIFCNVNKQRAVLFRVSAGVAFVRRFSCFTSLNASAVYRGRNCIPRDFRKPTRFARFTYVHKHILRFS